MICALLLGREGSSGFPGKNLFPVLGRPLAAYPLMTAKAAKSIDRIYVSTDSPRLKALASEYGARIIDRPAHLATKTALGEHAYVHGYQVIRDELAKEGESIELMVLLFANAVTLTPQIIEEGVKVLRDYPHYDSAVTVSCYNMWSPLRARKIGEDGLLHPFVPFEVFGDPSKLNCDRDSQGDVWFADMGVSIVRPRCLENLHEGLLPQKWMGRKIYPLKQWGGFDVDEAWQIPMLQTWLQAHEVERFSQTRRVSWSQYYESEQTVIARLGLTEDSKVLDFSYDCGGLGLALRERFGVHEYTAVCSGKQQAQTVGILYPEARVVEGAIESPASEALPQAAFDLVIGLGATDITSPLDSLLEKAFAYAKPGGALVASFRLTDQQTVVDPTRSYQESSSGAGTDPERTPYVVMNAKKLMAALRKLNPAQISGYGYLGKPSSTAVTPYRMVCFAVLAAHKAERSDTKAGPRIELQLPDNLLKAIDHSD
ncbi:MAG: hypothetical protein HY735_26365 [Verrucomicrobia bacterium]|nr:hypothetical protein [Verrucomicrobiota bacterium]